MNYLNTERRSCFRGPAKKLPKRIETRKLVAMALILVVTTVISTIGISAITLDSMKESRIPSKDLMIEAPVVLRDEVLETNETIEEDIFEIPPEDTKGNEESTSPYTDEDVEFIAKTVYGEALVTHSDMEMAAVAWCILNRVDDERFPDTIEKVVTQKMQFFGYKETNPVLPEVEKLVRDVLDRWCSEKSGEQDVGRVLPENYYYFVGDGRHNHFMIEWRSGVYWDWSLSNPYNS